MNGTYIACITLSCAAGFAFPTMAEEPVLPAVGIEAAAVPEAPAKVDDAASADATATPAAVEAAETAVSDAAPAAKESATAANAQDDPVICKRVEVTGTRLRKGKVCRPESVWRQQEKRAEDIMGGLERGSSAGVGGDDPGGG